MVLPLPGREPYSHGDVMVSTGIVRLDKRAEVSDLFKQGNFFQLTDNDNFVLAAA